MNKPKLNNPDVEIITTYNSSDVPETITINTTIPSKLFKDIYLPIAPNRPKPTLEEVKKEWEKLEYEWNQREHLILLYKRKIDKMICINTTILGYSCSNSDEVSLIITYQEHQLLTKTFRALDWEVNNE